MAINKKSNEMYIVYVGTYMDELVDCVTDTFAQASARKKQIEEDILRGVTARDMTARIETIRAYRKGQKVT